MGDFFVAIYGFFERRRALLWGLLAVVTGALVLFASRVGYSEQITGFFRGDESGRRQAMIFDHLRMMDRVVVMFSSDDPDRSIACAARFEELLSAGDNADYISSITSGVGGGDVSATIGQIYDNLPVYLTPADYGRLDSLLAAAGGVEQTVADDYTRLTSPLGMALRDVILRDPLGIASGKLAALGEFSSMARYEIYDGHIFSPGLSTMLLVIEPTHGFGDTGANEILVSEIERCSSRAKADEGDGGFEDVTIEYTGGPSVAVHNARRVKADTWLTLSIALVITVIFILATFRNRFAVVLILVPVVFGALFALGTIWLTGQHTMSAIAIGAGAAVLGIALSYSIHVVSHANHTSDPRRIIGELAWPLTVGGFTTIGAFLGLMFTGSELLRDFGLFAALTLVGTTIFCLVVLPHLLARGNRRRDGGGVQRIVERISEYPLDRNRAVIWTLVAVTTVCLFFYGRVGFDSDMMNLNYMSPELRAAEARLASFTPDRGQPVMFVSMGADPESAATACRNTNLLLDTLRAEGLISGYVSAAGFLPAPSVQRARIARWDEFWSGGRREETMARIERSALAAGFRAGAFDDFAATLAKTHTATDLSGDGRGNAPAFLKDWTGRAPDGTVMMVSQVKLAEADKEAVYARFAQRPDVVVVDRGYFAGRMAQGVRDDFNTTLAIASVLIFVALLVSYGRIELTLMAFMPMVVSWVIILGLMAMLGIEFNIVSIILSTFIFGIGDDFSIFIMDGLLAEYRDGKKMLSAHKTAIFFSSFTIFVGLGVLVLARHPAMHSLAVVSVLGILTVIVVAWVLQPVVFRFFVSSPTRRGCFPWTLGGVANSLYVFNLFLIGCSLLQTVMVTLAILPVSVSRRQLWFHRSVRFSTRMFLRLMITARRVDLNPSGETFERPAVIVANHQSMVDSLVLLAMTPKLVMVTNSRVWRSPIYGRIVRHAGFYNAADGYDNLADALRDKVAQGYSVVVFPEGTRSADMTIGRFHKGAFHLAEKLGLDILPVVLYGNGMVASKRQPLLIKKGLLVSKILPRITSADASFGEGYSLRAKQVGALVRREYSALRDLYDRTCNPYFHDALIKSYIYKGPVLEWYMRVKVRMERSYDWFDRTVPRDASVVDIGCGYGALACMLTMLSDRRRVLGIDYDEEKIAVARHSFLKSERTDFIAADALDVELPRADVFILNDVLHYMPFERQDELLARCFERLNPDGMVIVRDGDASEQRRHRATERTEKWSTKLVKFNKTVGELHFTDSERIAAAAHRAGFSVRVIDDGLKTSNKIYLCTTS
jgi:1-acyl-sn-glycerol-3-phosphate acyltransferase